MRKSISNTSSLNHGNRLTTPQSCQIGSVSPAATERQGCGSRVCGCMSELGEAEYTFWLEGLYCRSDAVFLLILTIIKKLCCYKLSIDMKKHYSRPDLDFAGLSPSLYHCRNESGGNHVCPV